MLSRVGLRYAQRGVSAVRRMPAAASTRALAADTRAALRPPSHVPTTPDGHERFDPSKWLTDETDPQVHAELARIRAAEDDAIAAVTQEVPEIDWEAWRKEIAYPGLVDELKAAHDAVPVPNVEEERARLQQAVHDAFSPLLAKLEKHAEDAEANSKVYQARLEEITHLHDNVASMPIDEFLAKYPAVKKSIEDDVANNRWFV